MILRNHPLCAALVLMSVVFLARCNPAPADPAIEDTDGDNDDDDDDNDNNDSSDGSDGSDDVNPDAWYGCADLDDCFYLCRDDEDCVDRCRYDSLAPAVEKWIVYRDCMNDKCGDFVEDSEDWNLCMDDKCPSPREDCLTDRGRDPDYVEVGPDSNAVGEIATNIFWYDPDEKDHCLRDDFYKEKKAIILEMGAAW